MVTQQSGALGGQLGSRTQLDSTFHGSDPETVATAAICSDTPTKCQARTRGRGCTGTGRSWPKDSRSARSATHMTDQRATIWLDLRDPDPGDLAVLGDEFGLHPVAVEDALHDWERPKIDRYRTHLFLTAYGARLDGDSGELATSELSAFVLRQALITVRKDDGIDIGKVVDRWDASPDLAGRGVGYLLHGLLDYIVSDDLMPYYQDVYDHVLRAAEWTDSLRDLVTTILETNLTIQGNRMNIITKKVTSWAAIIAVPTFITGFYGMNVPYPGFSHEIGLAASCALMVIAGVVLYLVFRRRDWL